MRANCLLLILQMLLTLLLILIAAEVFTNSLEHLGERLKVSEGVTGSVFAAVGTAMPESIIPITALVAGTGNIQVNHDIGVGSILGAPLMLSTLSVCLMASSVLRNRGLGGELRPEPEGLKRDLHTFLSVFGIAVIALFIPAEWRSARIFIAVILVAGYFWYVFQTVRASALLVSNGHGTESVHSLYMSRLGLRDSLTVIVIQLALGLVMLIAGAKGFIHSVEQVSGLLGISTLLLSMLIIPIATELPEKVNSILWIRRSKDTLAFGNITGAMVFQGSLLPALGLLFTPWAPRIEVIAGVTVTYLAALWLRLFAGKLKVWHVVLNGLFYLVYLSVVFSWAT